jgi:hypothetical protein
MCPMDNCRQNPWQRPSMDKPRQRYDLPGLRRCGMEVYGSSTGPKEPAILNGLQKIGLPVDGSMHPRAMAPNRIDIPSRL